MRVLVDELILAECQEGTETGQGIGLPPFLWSIERFPIRSARVGWKQRTMRVFTRPNPRAIAQVPTPPNRDSGPD